MAPARFVALLSLGCAFLLAPDLRSAPVQCVPTPKAGAEQEIFKDVLPGSLGEDEAVALKNDGVPVECWQSPLLFCPDCAISRAQFMLFLVGASNTPLVNPSTPTFNDVPTTSPYYQYVETAASEGWVGGCGGGAFCPEEPVTRGQAAVFLSVASGIPNATPSTPSFTDMPTSHVFFKFVEGLKLKCAGAGCSATAYCPNAALTRAEAAVLTARVFNIWTLGSCVAYGAAVDAGSGGAGGAGGAAGSAGSPADASAGAGGSAGASGSGAGGVGGAGTGGAGGSTSTGGSGGSGGSGGAGGSTSSGGSSGSAAGSAGTGGSSSEDDGGCGCRAPRSTDSGGLAALAGLVAFYVARRRARVR